MVTDPGVLAAHEVDWTGRFRGRALALVRPGSAAEVGEALRACAAAGVAVVPQGGNTGLVGGAVPHDAVVLSTARLTSIGEVDPVAGAVTAGAGVTLERLQRAAAEAGLAFGVDLAARGSATVGGMIATDAGGIHALRYGSMRRQVVGIEAVLADGTVVRQRAGGTAPAGVDLVSLLSGSEGTLAVITGARLRLVPVLSGAGNRPRRARRRRGRGCRHGPCPGAPSGPRGGRAGRRGLTRAGRLARRSARPVQRVGSGAPP